MDVTDKFNKFIADEFSDFTSYFNEKIETGVYALLNGEKPKVMVYGIYNKGDETHGKLYADASGFHIEHFPEENECNDCFEAYLFLSTKSIEAQYNIILQSSSNAKRTTFIPQIGDSAILCSSYIYSLPDGEKTTKGDDGIAVQFGMPVVISELTNGWCRINSIFNAPIGYIPIQDIEIIK